MKPVCYAVVLALVGAPVGERVTAEDPPTLRQKPTGVVVDFRSPPERANISMDFIITLDGQKEPVRHRVSYGGYSPIPGDGTKISWELQGYVVEKAGPTHMRFVGRKGKDGKLIPVRDIKFESPDLTPDQLPTVVRPKA
jgi:hypothetical protein